ncbi:MAG: tetratricopeptide repeat protein [Polyangiaceae bacterium]
MTYGLAAELQATGKDPEREAASFHEKGCTKGYVKSCTSLGSLAQSQGDSGKAKVLYARACEAGDAGACDALASGYATIGSKDALQAVVYSRRACELGSGLGCRRLAIALVEGKGVVANPSQGRQALERSCNLGEAGSCFVLADYLRKRGFGPNDPKAAAALHLINCNSKRFMASCAAVGAMYRTGEGSVQSAPDKARKLLELACGAKGDACVALAEMHANGEGARATSSERSRSTSARARGAARRSSPPAATGSRCSSTRAARP